MSGFTGVLLAGGGGASALGSLAAGDAFGDGTTGTGSSGAVTFNSDGGITDGSVILSGSVPTRWATAIDASVGNRYWLRATVTAGTLTAGTTGTWLALTSNRSYTKVGGLFGTSTATVTFEFATDAAGTTIVLTSTGWTIRFAHTL